MMTLAELSARLKPIPCIWLSGEEQMCLLKYAGLAQGPIVEIGTAWGGSACILTLGSDKQVVSIDPFQDKVDDYTIDSSQVIKIVQNVTKNQGNWELWIATSEQAHDKFAPFFITQWGQLGLVFIDGNHAYEYVQQDVSLWLPLIMPGGYLMLHDSIATLGEPTPSQAGPVQVAEELRRDPRVKLIETAYSMTVWEVL